MGAYNARLKPTLYLAIFPLWGLIFFMGGLMCAYVATDRGNGAGLWWVLAVVSVLISFIIAGKKDDLPYLVLYWQTWKETRARAREGIERE
ncbi:MAG: hypothetical protein AABY83_15275 [Pseudomonadota bacterium]